MWPLELEIQTPTLRCGPLSCGYGLPRAAAYKRKQTTKGLQPKENNTNTQKAASSGSASSNAGRADGGAKWISDSVIEALDNITATVLETMIHPLRDMDPNCTENKKEWVNLLMTTSHRRQIVRIGMDAETTTKLHYKYDMKGRPFEDRKVLFNFLYVLKHNPMYENIQWDTQEKRSPGTIWREFWSALDCFLDCADELDWAGRLNKYNHSPLYPYLVTLIGDCFPVGANGGTLNHVLFAPKYADEVYKFCCLWTNLGNIDGLVDWLVAPVVTHEF